MVILERETGRLKARMDAQPDLTLDDLVREISEGGMVTTARWP